ncbi:MAG: IS30 family transposase [Patescibacteria group bacterium]
MKIKELVFEDREEISRLLPLGLTFKDIGQAIGRDKGTISREVGRKGMNRFTYRACRAEKHARKQKEKRCRKCKIIHNLELEKIVLEKLRKKWSPMQIASTLKTDYADDTTMQVSHETIYSYVYVLPRGALKKEILACLRQQRKYRQKRSKKGNPEEKRGKIADMLSIEERPAEVADRIVPGHWEGDLILGKYKRTALGTLVERTTRSVILVHLTGRDATSVRRAYAREMKTLPEQMKLSLTYDQGKEMSEHKQFTMDTNMRVYFAHPGSPWERGTNENTNGLIRQFFPKGTDFNKVSKREVKKAQHLLNTRPRKTLNWETPQETFNKLVAINS